MVKGTAIKKQRPFGVDKILMLNCSLCDSDESLTISKNIKKSTEAPLIEF